MLNSLDRVFFPLSNMPQTFFSPKEKMTNLPNTNTKNFPTIPDKRSLVHWTSLSGLWSPYLQQCLTTKVLVPSSWLLGQEGKLSTGPAGACLGGLLNYSHRKKMTRAEWGEHCPRDFGQPEALRKKETLGSARDA